MPKPVIYAELSAGFFVPGMSNGNFTKMLPNPGKTLQGFKMTLQDNGSLLLEWEDGKFIKSYTVSPGNLVGCVHPSFLKEEPKPVIKGKDA